jgi:putative ABC transport system permease protein
MKPDRIIPPDLAKRFLRWFLRDDLTEEVQGDLEEHFYDHLEKISPLRAKLKYWFQVLNYLRPFAIRNIRSKFLYSNYTIMLRHHIIISFRSFNRYRMSFIINLLGLSTGLACVLLIYLWVNDELHIDKFHQADRRLYLVMANHQNADGIETWNGTPGLLARALKEEMPEVVYAVSGTDPDWFGQFSVGIDDKHIKARGEFVSGDFFHVFTYPLIEGDKDQVLKDKSSVAISQSLAGKLFTSEENAVGKMIDWQMGNIKKQFMVTGVFKDVPDHSSNRFDLVLPFDYFQDELVTYPFWNNNYAITWLVLNEGVNIGQFNNKIEDFVKEKGGESNVTLFVQRYSDNYLYGNFENGKQAGGRIEYVTLFSLIALFILIIACINFMNLSTARAGRRLKEVGIKKSMGAGRSSLIFQYLSESMLVTFFSLLTAFMLAILLLPQFNELTGKHLQLDFDRNVILTILGICFFTGMIAGSYPAFYLSAFNPVRILKGNLNTKSSETWIRKGLVIFQFTLSVILIVSVLIVYKQISFVRTRNLGFDKNHIIYIEKEGQVAENTETFINEVKRLPGVLNMAPTNFQVGRLGSTDGIDWKGKNPDENIPFYEVSVGYDAIEMLGLKMKEGRAFSRNFITDSTAVIFNEAAIKVMGIENPLGDKIGHYSGEKHIIGVVRNFNVESLYHEIKPLMFRFAPGNTNRVMLKIEKGKESEVLARLRKFYQNYNPGFTFNYRFLDTDYQALYTAEQRVSILSKYFAGLAILISCLGLFGLATFTAERRTREIGIRKVLGAAEISIIRLLSGDFAKMVMIAVILGIPLSYLIASNWLNDFAYRIELKWWYFMVSGIVAVVIALLTVGLQTFKAAQINPVQYLREE